MYDTKNKVLVSSFRRCCLCASHIKIIHLVHRQYTHRSVFDALSISSGLVAAVLLCMKRDVIHIIDSMRLVLFFLVNCHFKIVSMETFIQCHVILVFSRLTIGFL